MKVTLVLDDCCGERLAALDRPLWTCDSAANRAVAERLWLQRDLGPMSVTVFAKISASESAVIADMLSTIDEHHPEWTEIAVVGALATPNVRACFAPFAPGIFVDSGAGFRFVRSSAP